MLSNIFVASQVATPVLGNTSPQARNRSAIEEIFIKATRIEALALGLVYFLSNELSPTNEDGGELAKWATRIAIDTLRTGMDMLPSM